VVKDGYIKCAIEVKHKKRNLLKRNGRQFLKYKSIGVPVVYCIGEDSIESTLKMVKDEMMEETVTVDQHFIIDGSKK
jgi:hypothetical protein